MKAIVQERYGSPDVLELRELPRPIPGDEEVLVRVRAASVNAYDWHILSGKPYLVHLVMGIRKLRKPHIPGGDMAGVVEAVGAKVTRFKPGDEVYGETGRGGYAEYSVFPEKRLAIKPANLSFEQAAAVPMAALTALEGLKGVESGHRVLVNGASGGVGTFAVQIAKALGADVTGVCSTRNVNLVRSVGADHVIDYTQEDFTRCGQRYDLILDMIANHSLAACRRALTPKGTLVVASGNGSRWFGPVGRMVKALVLSPFVSQTLGSLVAKQSKADLGVLKELIESGRVTPAIDRVYPLSETPEALRYFGEEHARGKVVITV